MKKKDTALPAEDTDIVSPGPSDDPSKLDKRTLIVFAAFIGGLALLVGLNMK